MIKRLFSAIAFGLLLCLGHAMPIDTAAVRYRKMTAASLDGGSVLIPGQGLVPGLGLRNWGATYTRITFSDDSSYAQPQFDARAWSKLDLLDSLRDVDSSICWLRFHFKPDSSLDHQAARLHMVVSGSARIWLDGQPVLTHDLRQIRADQHLVEPDTAAFFIVPLHFAANGQDHVLAMRLEAGPNGSPPLRSLRASMHKLAAATRMHRGSIHLAVFAGVNAFVLVMALLFWRMDRHDRIWPWFAAFTTTNAFVALTELAKELDLGFGPRWMIWLERFGDSLEFAPFTLSVLLLVVMLGRATRRQWRWYLSAAIVLNLLAPLMVALQSFIPEDEKTTQVVLTMVVGFVVVVIGGWFLVETVRLSIQVIRSRGFQRWIGAGVLLGNGIPLLLPFVWMLLIWIYPSLQERRIPEGLNTIADYIGYIALPLSIITALAIRTTHQNRMLARQRDDLDKEVHERTAELRQERDRSENLLLNILPQEVAEELKATGAAEAKHFDQATVLFTDFKGFTAMSEKVTPVELLAELNSCFKAFDDIIARRGIEKIKTIGDAYMCVGGLPDPKSSAPIDVVLAALEMQEFMTKRCAERRAAGTFAFEMRSGINTGPVVAGIVGVKKFQYDIWGDTVNMASRMETTGEIRRVNISAGTHALVKDIPGLRFTKRGMVEVKGKGSAEMWFVDRA